VTNFLSCGLRSNLIPRTFVFSRLQDFQPFVTDRSLSALACSSSARFLLLQNLTPFAVFWAPRILCGAKLVLT